jgi:hypothetical protein
VVSRSTGTVITEMLIIAPGQNVSVWCNMSARGSHGIPDIKEPAITAAVGTPIVDGDCSAMVAVSTVGYTLCL